MARKTVALQHQPIDEMFVSVLDELRQDYDGYAGGEEESRVICLPVPLAFQYALQQEGFTLGRFTTVVGLPESCKSAFGYELFRLHRVQNGGFVLIETEKKDSPELRKSITGYDERRCSAYYVEFLEDWQSCLEENLTKFKAYMDAKLKPPRSVPVCFLIDSLAGVTTEHIGGKIDKEGHASLEQPHIANIISTFMKRMNHWFANYPMSVIGVNHLKLQKDQHGHNSIRNLQGGYAPRFAESLEIELYREDGGKEIDRREPRRERGIPLKLVVRKNSSASHPQPLKLEMLWYFETLPDGRDIQRTYWDWDAAAIELLADPPLDVDARKEIRAVVDLHPIITRREVWSKALGIPQDDPVSYRQAGQLLEARPDLKEQLYRPLGIRRRFMFESGKDYQLQRAAAAQRVLKLRNDGMPALVVPVPAATKNPKETSHVPLPLSAPDSGSGPAGTEVSAD